MQRKLFILNAAGVCGPRVAFAPPQAFAIAPKAGQHSHYYFLSMSSLPRQIENTGTMKFINTAEGQKILYTHYNGTGNKPTADAEIVHFLFGPTQGAPVETHPIVNRTAYAAYKARIGAKYKSPLRADMAAAALRPPMPSLRLPQNKPTPNPNNG